MYKQAIIVRKDLDWGKGKLGAHCAHAAVASARKVDEKILEKWEKEGSKKIVLKVFNLNELKEICKKAKLAKLPYVLVSDAGLTQLKQGTVTALGIGPVEERQLDKITKKLKLL